MVADSEILLRRHSTGVDVVGLEAVVLAVGVAEAPAAAATHTVCQLDTMMHELRTGN